MKFLKFHSHQQKRGLSYVISEFLSLLKKLRQSYAIYEISYPSPKTWNIILNLSNFFPFSKNVLYQMQFLKFLSLVQKVEYHMLYLEFLFFLQKHGLSYSIYKISFSSPKTCNVICNFRISFSST